MLVLKRKPNQRLVFDCPAGVDGEINVTVLASSAGRVTLGIEAPDAVTVLRGELADEEDPTVVTEREAA